jgi:hypothetical protein
MVAGGTSVVCLSLNPAAFKPQARLLSQTLATMSLLAGLAWFSAARADAFGSSPVDFYFDLVGDRLADADSDAADSEHRMLIAGVPVRVNGREGDAETDRRMTAGANGRYVLNFADALHMVGKAKIAGTDYIDEQTPAAAVASAGADFRYATAGWTLGLKPGVEAIREETGFAQRDSLIEGRASKAIAPGLSIAATGRYRWRTTAEGEAMDREIASARIGFASQLRPDMRMDVAYVGRQETLDAWAEYGQSSVIHSHGPSFAVALSLDPTVDLSANYEFTDRSSYDAAEDAPAWRSEDQHRLNLALTWELGGNPDAMRLSTGYRFEHVGASAGDRAGARHAGTVNFAVFF